jgi:hypothetical protein
MISEAFRRRQMDETTIKAVLPSTLAFLDSPMISSKTM